jgi:hypothetical protein
VVCGLFVFFCFFRFLSFQSVVLAGVSKKNAADVKYEALPGIPVPIPRGFWTDKANRRLFCDSLEQKLKLASKSDWYYVSRNYWIKYGGVYREFIFSFEKNEYQNAILTQIDCQQAARFCGISIRLLSQTLCWMCTLSIIGLLGSLARFPLATGTRSTTNESSSNGLFLSWGFLTQRI